MKEAKKNMNKQDSASTKKTGSNRSGKKGTAGAQGFWSYVWRLRGAIVSLPVLIFSIVQAFRNASMLPERVGFNLQATGEFAMTLSRPAAVVIPLLVTIGCIILTCFTKRPLFPWLVSVFSLVVPVLILVINVYPA